MLVLKYTFIMTYSPNRYLRNNNSKDFTFVVAFVINILGKLHNQWVEPDKVLQYHQII